MHEILKRDAPHEFPIVVATMTASAQERKIAFGAFIGLVSVIALTVPFANVQLSRVDDFLPVVQTVISVADLFTAAFLFAHFSVRPKRALLALAGGFVFSGLFASLQILIFPGAYAPDGLIAHQLNGAGWVCIFWQGSFSLAVIAYTLLRDTVEPVDQAGLSRRVAIGVTIACVATATAGLTWIAATFADDLPSLVDSATNETFFSKHAHSLLVFFSAVAIVLLFVRKRTILDHWLIVTLIAWLPNLAVGVLSPVQQFTVGWYTYLLFALVAGSALLLVLLAETMELYSRAAAAARIAAQQRTELSVAMAALKQVNLWFDTALKNITQGLSMFDKDQRLVLCNGRYGEIYGFKPDQIRPGTELRSILEARAVLGGSPDYDHIEERLRLVRSPQPAYDENRLSDGRVIAVNFQPMPDGGWVAVHQEITERKRVEEHQALLVSELDHRVKNILARVAVVAKYTRQGSRSIDEFLEALDGRIQSMADAHTLLSQSHWRGVSLADLVRRQLAPYTTEANMVIGGPNVTLSVAATQAVAMVLQELATNAAKYGSLSPPQGKVSVNWERGDGADGAPRVMIAWRETDGPRTKTPSDTSYGANLIRNLIPHELGGKVDLVFAPEGVRCDIEIPLQAPPAN
jgi:PAS domain S-box-containing protein